MKSNPIALKGFFFDKKQCIKKMSQLKKMRRLISHLNNPGFNPLLRIADSIAWPQSNEKAFIKIFKAYIPLGKKDYELAVEYIGVEAGSIDLQEAMRWIEKESRYITEKHGKIGSSSLTENFMLSFALVFAAAYLIGLQFI